MTEDEARDWISTHFDVPRGTWKALETYVALLLDEMGRQNLIAESTRDQIWARHIVDCAQLLPLPAKLGLPSGTWLDVGAGAGLPGVVVAILSDWPVRMVEPRRKRVEFLQRVIDALTLSATVEAGKVESLPPATSAIISARAYAPLPRLLETTAHLSDSHSLWLLPKGRNWKNELETTRQAWQGEFHVERSVTDPESAIILARSVTRKRGRR